MEYSFSKHCLEQIRTREITEEEIIQALKKPDKIITLDSEITV